MVLHWSPVRPRVHRFAAVVLLALTLTSAVAPPVQAQSSRVYVVAIDDVVGQGTVLDVERAVEVAEENDAPLVVRLSTPGGLVKAEQRVTSALLNADVPVITYVGPRGASAFSAGTYILLAGHVAAMNNGTSMGSAMPVVSGPTGTRPASNKTINALASRMRFIAESRHRPVRLAEDMVRNNTDYTSSEAHRADLINLTSSDLRDLLVRLDGRSVDVDGRSVTLQTENAEVVEVSAGFTSELYRLVGNPQITFFLILIGMYGLIFGFAAGGTYVPETIGAILLLLGLFGLGLFDFSTAALLLIGLAIVFFIAEALTPTHGILTTAGAVTLAIGALMLPSQEPLLGGQYLEGFQFVVIGMAAFTGVFIFAVITFGIQSLLRTEPYETVRGRRGETTTDLAPRGRVRVRGEIWRAELADDEPPIPARTEIEVVDRDGLTLKVRRSVRAPGEEE